MKFWPPWWVPSCANKPSGQAIYPPFEAPYPGSEPYSGKAGRGLWQVAFVVGSFGCLVENPSWD